MSWKKLWTSIFPEHENNNACDESIGIKKCQVNISLSQGRDYKEEGTLIQSETFEKEPLPPIGKHTFMKTIPSLENDKGKSYTSVTTCNTTSEDPLQSLIHDAEESSSRDSKIGTNITQKKAGSVKGTTFIFTFDSKSNNVSFKKFRISSEKISISKYPNVVAIQTLQFQKTSWKLSGHACMVNQKGIWKLFFVHDSSTFHNGQILGYMYNGDIVASKDLISYSISKENNKFYWVNLLPEKFSANSLPDLKYPISIGNGCYYGNHTPSRIQLPSCNSEYQQNLVMAQKIVNVGKSKTQTSTTTTEKTNSNNVYVNTQLNNIKRAKSRLKPHKHGGRTTIPIFRTKKTDGIHYLTIFQPDNYDVDYKKFLDSSTLYIAAPYNDKGMNIANHPFRKMHYALIHYSNVQILQELTKKEYNDTLDRVGVLKFSLYQPTIDQPTRFCIVNKKEFDYMTANPKLYSWDAVKPMDDKKQHCCELKMVGGDDGDDPKFLYGITDLPHVMLPGICVSMWKYSKEIQDVSLDFINTIEKCFGRGFGDRSCAPCLGVNSYFGHHYNKRVIDRPETQPGTRFHDHYGRQTDKYQEMIPICQKYIYAQARRVREEAQKMNNNYMLFVGYDTCDRIIWTQGINHNGKLVNNNGNQNQRCISFANKFHIDKCDIIKNETTKKWFDWLNQLKNTTCKDEERKMSASHVIGKFKELETTFGIGLPTTCGYSHVTADESNIVEINSSFIQMNFAMKIFNSSMHHMYAWTFPHATALTIAVTSDSKVLVHSGGSQEYSVNVAAWGKQWWVKTCREKTCNLELFEIYICFVSRIRLDC